MRIKNQFFVSAAIFFVIGVIVVIVLVFWKGEIVQPGDIAPADDVQVYTSARQFYDSADRDINGVYWANFDKHQNINAVLLNDVISQGVMISSEGVAFIRFMSQRNFDIFLYRDDEDLNYGLYLSFDHLENYPGNSYEDALTALDIWGPHMLEDLKGVLFPREVVSVEDLGQSVSFSAEYSLATDLGLKYKSAEVVIGSEKRDIYYGVVDGYVILTTSKKSLFEVSRELFSLVP